jgi:uncharacterized protein
MGMSKSWATTGMGCERGYDQAFYVSAAATCCWCWCMAGVEGAVRVTNSTRGTTLAACAEIADTPEKRRLGLLGRESLLPGQGMWLPKSGAVHTFGMKFPIDVVFLDSNRFIVGILPNMAQEESSGRFPYCKVDSILELPAGTVGATGTREGDELEIVLERQSDAMSLGLALVTLVFIALLAVTR